MNFRYFLFVLSVFLLFSCGDDGAPVINITSPDNGATYAPGSTVNLSATVTDDVGVTTINVTSNDLGINKSDQITDSPTSITYNLDITLLAETEANEYEMTVTATDTDGNFSDEKITIKVE